MTFCIGGPSCRWNQSHVPAICGSDTFPQRHERRSLRQATGHADGELGRVELVLVVRLAKAGVYLKVLGRALPRSGKANEVLRFIARLLPRLGLAT